MQKIPLREVLFSGKTWRFSYPRFVYTEDVGGSSPSSPTTPSLALCGFAALRLLKYEVAYRFTGPALPGIAGISELLSPRYGQGDR